MGASDGSIFLSVGPPIGILLPPQTLLHDIADLEARVVRFYHLADSAAGHHLADAYWGRVGRRIAHPAAHVRVERKIDDADQDLARARLRHCDLFDAKIGLRRLARRPTSKNDAAVGFRDHCLPLEGIGKIASGSALKLPHSRRPDGAHAGATEIMVPKSPPDARARQRSLGATPGVLLGYRD